MKLYKLFIRYWSDQLVVDIVETNDIYHEIGKIYCETMESIKRIDYKELKSVEDCPIYEPACTCCVSPCNRYLEEVRRNENSSSLEVC